MSINRSSNLGPGHEFEARGELFRRPGENFECVGVTAQQLRILLEKSAQIRCGGEYLFDAVASVTGVGAVLVGYEGYVVDPLAAAVASFDWARHVEVHASDPGFT